MQRLKFLTTTTFIHLSCVALCQFGFQFDNSVVVNQNGAPLTNPWAGGLNYVQISDFDYDFDCDMDLFLFDRSKNNIRVYTQEENAGIKYYQLAYNSKINFNLIKEKKDKEMLTPYANPYNWPRNTNCWAKSLDLTGYAACIVPLGGVGGGTLITKKHVLLSNHVPYSNSPFMIFFINNNGSLCYTTHSEVSRFETSRVSWRETRCHNSNILKVSWRESLDGLSIKGRN